MNTRSIPTLFLLVGLVFTTSLRAGEVIDRIVAIVNGNVILQSQLEDDLCFEALSEARPLKPLADEDRHSALDHLVDQELLREQMQGGEMHQPSSEQVQKRIQEIRKAHPGAESDAVWQTILARYGLNEKQLELRVTRQLALLREADVRLRPSVQIENDRIAAYYHDVFLPRLRQAGAPEVPLAEVSSQIREILTQQKIDELFDAWIQSLRKDSKVRTLLPGDAASFAGEATR
jgi:parvulin-like peptidyl-prolyl isomerase